MTPLQAIVLAIKTQQHTVNLIKTNKQTNIQVLYTKSRFRVRVWVSLTASARSQSRSWRLSPAGRRCALPSSQVCECLSLCAGFISLCWRLIANERSAAQQTVFNRWGGTVFLFLFLILGWWKVPDSEGEEEQRTHWSTYTSLLPHSTV